MSKENGRKKDIGFIALTLGAVLNMGMAIVKFYVGLSTNCVSILADGYNNAADSIGNVVGAVGWKLARKKSDDNYTHGYGRFETLITFLVLTISIAVGAYFVYCSLERLFFRLPITFLVIDFVLIAVTALLKIAMFFVFRALNKKYPSPLLAANRQDAVMDSLITVCTLTAYGLGTYISLPVDAFAGIAIGIVIIVTTAKLWRASVRDLLGASDGELLSELKEKLSDFPCAVADSVLTDAFVCGEKRIVYVEIATGADDEQIAQTVRELERLLSAEVRVCCAKDSVAEKDLESNLEKKEK